MVTKIPPKLYKFQSFENKNSIENLRHCQIWFSKPEGLNDPFDCAIPANFVGTGDKEVMAKFIENFYSHRIPRSLLRGFYAFAKPVPEGAKFRNTPSACGGDRNFEGFASLF